VEETPHVIFVFISGDFDIPPVSRVPYKLSKQAALWVGFRRVAGLAQF